MRCFSVRPLRDAGIPLSEISLKYGVFGAEPWTEEMRRRIEELLGIKAHDIYGLSEIMGPGVSYECGAQEGDAHQRGLFHRRDH